MPRHYTDTAHRTRESRHRQSYNQVASVWVGYRCSQPLWFATRRMASALVHPLPCVKLAEPTLSAPCDSLRPFLMLDRRASTVHMLLHAAGGFTSKGTSVSQSLLWGLASCPWSGELCRRPLQYPVMCWSSTLHQIGPPPYIPTTKMGAPALHACTAYCGRIRPRKRGHACHCVRTRWQRFQSNGTATGQRMSYGSWIATSFCVRFHRAPPSVPCST